MVDAVEGALSLAGRSVLVVGATGGLGSSMTALLAGRGADLTLVARDEARLVALRDRCAPGARIVPADIRRAGTAESVVAAAAPEGVLDGLVVTSGIVAFGAFEDLPDDVAIDLFTTNTLAPMRILRAANAPLRAAAQAGRDPFALVVSAVVAETPMAGMAAYSASKAALTAFDAAVARELRRGGVRLIDARPPHTETGLATRPVHGEAPRLPQGLDPQAVAGVLLEAILDGRRDVPSADFDRPATGH